MNVQDLSAFLQVLHDATGMDFSAGRAEIVRRRIEDRMRALEILSWWDYRNRITLDPDELSRLIESVAVNETYFFRHPKHFEHLRRIVRTSEPPIRIWSAGCSNGCEPYSAAIVVLEEEAARGPRHCEILASDIDSVAIEEAKRGCFTERETSAGMDPATRDRHFLRMECGRWVLSDAGRRAVAFRRTNLVTDVLPIGCDVIFCRNVLYYLSEPVRERVIRRLWRALRPGGTLFLAPTEPVHQWDAYFHPVDGPERILEAWSTDDSGTTRGSWGFPGALRGTTDRLVLSGRIEIPDDIEELKRSLAFEVGRLGEAAVLDATKLDWIANEVLHELRITLEIALRRGGMRIREARVASPRVRDWFQRAGFEPVTGRVLLEGEPSPGNQARPPLPALEPVRAVVPVLSAAAPPPLGSCPARIATPPPEPKVLRVPSIAEESFLSTLRDFLAMAIGSGPDARHLFEVVLDFSYCRLLDERAAILIGRAVRAQRAGQRIVLRGASPAVERLLQQYLPEGGAVREPQIVPA